LELCNKIANKKGSGKDLKGGEKDGKKNYCLVDGCCLGFDCDLCGLQEERGTAATAATASSSPSCS
jgi:hypothetical protein